MQLYQVEKNEYKSVLFNKMYNEHPGKCNEKNLYTYLFSSNLCSKDRQKTGLDQFLNRSRPGPVKTGPLTG
jgi:hypothetical protein